MADDSSHSASQFPMDNPFGGSLKPFERLKKEIKRPPASLEYNRDAPLANLFAFKGTALKLVLKRPEFWVFVGLHILLVVLYHGKYQGGVTSIGDTGVALKDKWPKMSTALALIPGTLMAIFITFYVNQTFSRYFDQYFKRTDVHSVDILNLLRSFVVDGENGQGRDVRQHIFKYILTAQILGYAGLPQFNDTKVRDWAWKTVKELGLLTEQEADQLLPLWSTSGTAAFTECLVAANRAVWAQLKTKLIRQLDQCLLLAQKINDLRTDFLAIHAYAGVPIPFSYYHLLNVFLELYLALLAYVFVFEAPYWSIAGYTLIVVALLGFREIGNAMSDPFGDDDVDIPVFRYAERVFREASLLIDETTSSYVDEPQFAKLS